METKVLNIDWKKYYNCRTVKKYKFIPQFEMFLMLYDEWKNFNLKEVMINESCEYTFWREKLVQVESISLNNCTVFSKNGVVFEMDDIDLEKTLKLKESEGKMKKATIVNRDYSVLLELESVNKWGMKTKIEYITPEFIHIIENSYFYNKIDIRKNKNIPDDYIIERLAQYGFDITLQDVAVIDTLEKLKKFLSETNLQLGTVNFNESFGFFKYSSKKANEYIGNKKEIEKMYNVKIELEL